MSDERRGRDDDSVDAELMRMLDEAAAIEAAERAEAERIPDAPGARDVERILREQWSKPRVAPARWTKPRVLGLCVAAALMLVFVVIWNRSPEDDGPSGQYLGDDRARITSPTGRVDEWPTHVRWTADPLARAYEVDILDDDSGRVLFELGRTIATEIEFPTKESVAWPAKIEIRVKSLLKDGTQSTASARVELAQ